MSAECPRNVFGGRSSPSLDEADPVLWVNAGRKCLGRVYETAGEFVAVTESGADLGAFANAREAAEAIRLAGAS
jgi:hypothetical protein